MLTEYLLEAELAVGKAIYKRAVQMAMRQMALRAVDSRQAIVPVTGKYSFLV